VSDLDLPALLAAARAITEESDAVALRHFQRGVSVTSKPDGSPVTAADREVESLLRRRIAEAFPQHAVLGEEEGGGLDPHAPTWVIDPIDATKNFIRGIPVWATLLALVVEGEPVVGVASAPAMGERWDAARGLGARRNASPITVSGVASLADAHVLHGGLDWFRQTPGGWDLLARLAERAWRTRGFGDFWMHLLVAGGMAEVAIERDLEPWDVAPLACIVAEAGGRMTSWRGDPVLTSGEALTTNGLLHAELMVLVS
jgi:histidinol-phosphatase